MPYSVQHVRHPVEAPNTTQGIPESVAMSNLDGSTEQECGGGGNPVKAVRLQAFDVSSIRRTGGLAVGTHGRRQEGCSEPGTKEQKPGCNSNTNILCIRSTGIGSAFLLLICPDPTTHNISDRSRIHSLELLLVSWCGVLTSDGATEIWCCPGVSGMLVPGSFGKPLTVGGSPALRFLGSSLRCAGFCRPCTV